METEEGGSVDKSHRRLRASRRLHGRTNKRPIRSPGKIGTVQLIASTEKRLYGAAIREVEYVERQLEPTRRESEVASNPDVPRDDSRSPDLPLSSITVSEPSRGRERIRHHASVRQSYRGWAEARVRGGDARDDGAREES